MKAISSTIKLDPAQQQMGVITAAAPIGSAQITDLGVVMPPIQAVQPMYRQVIIQTEITMAMTLNAELTTRAIVAIMSFACRNTVKHPHEGTLMDCVVCQDGGLVIDKEELVEHLASVYAPEMCEPEFLETFCSCQPGYKCRTCNTAEETMALYTEIMWDVIWRTVIPFHALPKGYSGGMGVDPIGPNEILVTFV